MGIQLPEDRGLARRQAAYRWVAFGLVAVLIALLAYLGYAGYVGSARLIDPPDRSTDCRTPTSAFGWAYEAINYPIASDASLDANPDRTHCPTQGAPAGEALTAADGTRLAGWYIPAGGGVGATGPTVVLAHGLGENKSHLLDWAVPLHDDYNLVLFDFRGHGQSGAGPSTAGVREQGDLRSVLDWLEASKAPGSIALFGLSAGGAAVINLADADPRVDAVILDSTHATLANAVQAQLEAQGYPLSVPAAWAILLGGLLRTGEDMSSVDPVQAVERYGDRPLLLIYAGRDTVVGAGAAADMLAAAAAGGTDAEIETCPDATHEGAADGCAADYRSWVLAFLARSLP